MIADDRTRSGQLRRGGSDEGSDSLPGDAIVALSTDPEKKARQLANLKRGGGAWKPGATVRVKHGLRTRRPDRLLLGQAADEIVGALGSQVPLRGPDGLPLPEFSVAIEAAALELLIVKRCAGWLGTNGYEDERGRLRTEEIDGLRKALGSLRRSLEGLGATPAAYARLGFDVVRTDEVMRTAAGREVANLSDAELDARLAGFDSVLDAGRAEDRARNRARRAQGREKAPETPEIDDLDEPPAPRRTAADRRRELAPGRSSLTDLRRRINHDHEE